MDVTSSSSFVFIAASGSLDDWSCGADILLLCLYSRLVRRKVCKHASKRRVFKGGVCFNMHSRNVT